MKRVLVFLIAFAGRRRQGRGPQTSAWPAGFRADLWGPRPVRPPPAPRASSGTHRARRSPHASRLPLHLVRPRGHYRGRSRLARGPSPPPGSLASGTRVHGTEWHVSHVTDTPRDAIADVLLPCPAPPRVGRVQRLRLPFSSGTAPASRRRSAARPPLVALEFPLRLPCPGDLGRPGGPSPAGRDGPAWP